MMRRQRFLQLSALLCATGGFLLERGGYLQITRQLEEATGQRTTKGIVPRMKIDSHRAFLGQIGSEAVVSPGTGAAGGGMMSPTDIMGVSSSNGMMSIPGGTVGIGMPNRGGKTSFPARESLPLVIWNKPDVLPKWLTRGRDSMKRIEETRNALETVFDPGINYDQVPLQLLLERISDTLDVRLEIDLQGLEAQGQNVESPVTLNARGPVRTALDRILKPLDCGYIVHEGYVLITSSEVADSTTSLRAYDLTAVLPNNSHSEDLFNLIQATISPVSWESGDARMSILGSVLVVVTCESIHLEIERLLSSITNPNLIEPEIVDPEKENSAKTKEAQGLPERYTPSDPNSTSPPKVPPRQPLPENGKNENENEGLYDPDDPFGDSSPPKLSPQQLPPESEKKASEKESLDPFGGS